MAPKPDVSEERTEQIIEAAIQVFTETGFSETRMDDIAKAAGLSKGTLYLYFKSKDAIIHEIMQRFFDTEMRQIAVFDDQTKSVTERLLEGLSSVANTFDQFLPMAPVMIEFYAMAARDEKTRQVLAGFYDEFHRSLRPLIQEGIDNGEFRAVNPDQVSMALVSIIEGTGILWTLDPAMNWKEQVFAAGEMLVEGIKAH
jgi:AcrR family transcriptional regulator